MDIHALYKMSKPASLLYPIDGTLQYVAALCAEARTVDIYIDAHACWYVYIYTYIYIYIHISICVNV